MNKIAKTVVATVLAGSALVGVNACGLGTPDHVSGDRDDIRQVPAHTETKTKKKSNGKTETKIKTTPGYYCVELDNVNGDADRDDEWYRVNVSTYLAAQDADEGSAVEFSPLNTGC